MPPYKPPVYPKELSDQVWQKSVKPLAKLPAGADAAKISKELVALQKAFAAIKPDTWKLIDFEYHAPGHIGSRTPDDIKEGIANARAAAKSIQPVYKMCTDLEADTKYLAVKWKTDKKVPKSAIAAAALVSDKAKWLSFQIAFGTFAGVTEAGIKAEEVARKNNQALFAKLLKDVPAKLDKLVKDIAKGVTLAEWPNFWKQDVRYIGTQLPGVLKAHPNTANDVRDFRVHSNTCNTPKDQGELDKWLRELTVAAKALKTKIG
jgi:hypothetical protein